jgi:hypothetical protein
MVVLSLACPFDHARQAFRALRSLVKLQANVAIRFMKVLVRLQVRVRARQLLLTRPRSEKRTAGVAQHPSTVFLLKSRHSADQQHVYGT